nr:MAG TPA: hypothetical protein [Caudoviricetes sp.]
MARRINNKGSGVKFRAFFFCPLLKFVPTFVFGFVCQRREILF